MKQCSCGAYLKECPKVSKRCNACREYLRQARMKNSANSERTKRVRRETLQRILKKHGVM